MNFDKPSGAGSDQPTRLTRRDFLRNTSTTIAAFVLMPALAAEAQREPEIPTIIKTRLDEELSFDRATLDRVLTSRRTAAEITPAELMQVVRFSQYLFHKLKGGTFQERLRSVARGQANHEMEVVVYKTNRYLNAVGKFVHSTDFSRPSTAYVRFDVPAADLFAVVFHELIHGAYGAGETRAVVYTTLATLYALAHNSSTAREQLIHNDHLLGTAWIPENRRQLLQNIKHPGEHSTYKLAPAYAYMEYGKLRAEPGNSLTFQDFIDRLSHMTDRVYASDLVHELVKDGRVDTKRLEEILDELTRETVFQLLRFNPEAQVPPHLHALRSAK